MSRYLSVSEVSELWNVKQTQITRYCRDGRIDGAIKKGGDWMIPEGSQKPGYGQKSICEVKSPQSALRKPLPVGVTGYKEICSSYYYIDKTMLIKDFLDERPKVSLFTRPRRFGKTLTMDMLRVFFEKSEEDTSVFFKDKQIWEQGEDYRAYQGKYPVVYLSFKDARKDDWNLTRDHINSLIASEYRRHSELKTGGRALNMAYYDKVADGTADPAQMDGALRELTIMLHEHYGEAPVVIIDEYDTPIQQARAKGFYPQAADFMSNLYSGAFKDNEHLAFGFLTGILPAADEHIFSGLNNLKMYPVTDNRFAGYFGFTEQEVREMCSRFDAEDKYDEICAWYGGYRFGETEIFNPWSIINYFSDSCCPRPFWENTGSNAVIRDIPEAADEEMITQMNTLLKGGEIKTLTSGCIRYPGKEDDPSSLYSFLLSSGYLSAVKREQTPDGNHICSVCVPNREISCIFRNEITGYSAKNIPQAVLNGIREALYLGDETKLGNKLQQFLLESISGMDLSDGKSYRMMMLSLSAIMCDSYDIHSTRENGEGRLDILLIPKDPARPVIIIEMKHQKNTSSYVLRSLAEIALRQINEKPVPEMKERGIERIIKYGAAFSGRTAEIVMES